MSCDSCAESGPPKGYCAPLRCYCGHKGCPAFANYVDPRNQRVDLREVQKSTNLHAKSWAEREDETWLDKL